MTQRKTDKTEESSVSINKQRTPLPNEVDPKDVAAKARHAAFKHSLELKIK